MRYRALRDLFYPIDKAIVRRLAAGEDLPMRARGMRVVAAGDIADDLPAISVPVLLAKGWIEEVTDGGPVV